MIALHSVSIELGKGALRKLVLDNVSWVIPPRGRYVILGQRGAGKTTLLSVISGSRFPTAGWVERGVSICPNRGLMRGAIKNATARQLATQLARLYGVSPPEVVAFVSRFADVGGAMDFPVKSLPAQLRRRLDYGLIYAIPFNFYLFDGLIGPAKGDFGERCRRAFDTRCQEAGVIVTTSWSRIARKFDGNGGVLHKGKLTLFDTVDEAISVFEALPPPDSAQGIVAHPIENEEEEEEEEWL